MRLATEQFNEIERKEKEKKAKHRVCVSQPNREKTSMK